MAEIVNLRMARKARKRGEAEREAEVNRGKHGLTKGEKLRQAQEREQLARQIDGAKREPEG